MRRQSIMTTITHYWQSEGITSEHRNLFRTKIALPLDEPPQADLVLVVRPDLHLPLPARASAISGSKPTRTQ
jgi:hypothetical protein